MFNDALLIGLGVVGGSALTTFVFALLTMSKKTDTEDEKLASYQAGYKKGFEDGSKPQKTV